MKSYTTFNNSMIHRGALKTAGKGKPVFPCKDKQPLTHRGFKDATTDPARVTAFWTRHPDAKIGMPTGRASGVFVVDVDQLEALGALQRELPETLTIRTPSGGLHFYFHHVEGITNRRGTLPAGIDVRGEGGYVIVPPSDGYTVECHAPVADAPEWLLETIKDEPRTKPSGPGRTQSRANISDDGGPIHEGTRNATLASIAGRLHNGTRDLAQLEADLQAVNESRCVPPLEGAEVQGIAKSIHRLAPCRTRGRGVPPNPEVIGILGDILKDWWRMDCRGTGGKSNRDVLLAYILFALEGGTILPNGGILIDVSHHQVAERARKSSSTAYNSHKRLSVKGWCRGGGNGPDRREDQPSGIVLLPRLQKQRKPEHPLPGEAAFGGVFDFASLPPARRGRHSSPGLVRVASAGRIACIDHMERINAWVPARVIADALGISRAYDMRKRYLEPLEARGIVERSGKLWGLTEGWQEALEQLFEEEEALERKLYSGLTADERQKKRREESRERWRNRENSHPESAPSEDDMRESRDSYPERRREAIKAALARLFREYPEYRGRRVGQITCRLMFFLPDELPRGADGVPKDAEVEAILDGERGAA
jgi:DNA-binding MarR family transcriptional regulator